MRCARCITDRRGSCWWRRFSRLSVPMCGVNMVTPELFRRFPTPDAMMKAKLPELEELIKTTGFFRNKAEVD